MKDGPPVSAPGPLRRLSLAAACLAGVASLALVSLNPLVEEASATAAPALASAPRSAVQAASTAASAREEVLINEDFGTRTTIPGGWTPKSGTWTVAGGALKQTSPKGITMLTFGNTSTTSGSTPPSASTRRSTTAAGSASASM